jgi:hypothetical protein
MAILAADAAGYSRLMSITGNYDRGVECARLGLSDAPMCRSCICIWA